MLTSHLPIRTVTLHHIRSFHLPKSTSFLFHNATHLSFLSFSHWYSFSLFCFLQPSFSVKSETNCYTQIMSPTQSCQLSNLSSLATMASETHIQSRICKKKQRGSSKGWRGLRKWVITRSVWWRVRPSPWPPSSLWWVFYFLLFYYFSFFIYLNWKIKKIFLEWSQAHTKFSPWVETKWAELA